jgi:histidyl-tRNA synthetase
MSPRIASLSGFPELLPHQRFVELDVIDRLRRTFELHGFAPVETRAAEPLEQLLRKGEIDKEVYVLRRMQEAGRADAAAPADELGLHYDLTVPFARYVLEHAGSLQFPFRRYQIQKVWRGERPQDGRYREFTQADIDVVARDELPFHHDVEVARVMAEALAGLEFLPPLRLQLNNRMLIEGFYRGLGVVDPDAVMRVIDKLDKQPVAAVERQLADDGGLSASQVRQTLQLAEIRTSDRSVGVRVRALGVQHPLLDRGLAELDAVLAGCLPLANDRLAVEADLRIARGLDYYTGTVFETRMSGFEHLGSICSGGRYEALASDGRNTYPGVGISLGLTRMLMPLFQRGLLAGSRAVPSAVLVALPDEASRDQVERIAAELRRRGVPTEVSASAAKYGRQIRDAERRGIPFVWFPGDGDKPDQVKDIRSGEQSDAVASQWRPPDRDLRPQAVTPDRGAQR